MKVAAELYYGKCSVQCFWSLMDIMNSKAIYTSLCCHDYMCMFCVNIIKNGVFLLDFYYSILCILDCKYGGSTCYCGNVHYKGKASYREPVCFQPAGFFSPLFLSVQNLYPWWKCCIYRMPKYSSPLHPYVFMLVHPWNYTQFINVDRSEQRWREASPHTAVIPAARALEPPLRQRRFQSHSVRCLQSLNHIIQTHQCFCKWKTEKTMPSVGFWGQRWKIIKMNNMQIICKNM